MVISGGKVTVAGSCFDPCTPTEKISLFTTPTVNLSVFALARFNLDGTLDTDFNEDRGESIQGTVWSDCGVITGCDDEMAFAVTVAPDGKIVVAGQAYMDTGSSPWDMQYAIVRLNAGGTADTSFGNDGWVTSSSDQIDGRPMTMYSDRIKAVAVMQTPSGAYIFAAGQTIVNDLRH
jgi:uncharacterized delta-60 repeat protein